MTMTDPTRRGGYPAPVAEPIDLPTPPCGPAPGTNPTTASQPTTPGDWARERGSPQPAPAGGEEADDA